MFFCLKKNMLICSCVPSVASAYASPMSLNITMSYHPKALAFITHFPWALNVCSMTSRPQP